MVDIRVSWYTTAIFHILKDPGATLLQSPSDYADCASLPNLHVVRIQLMTEIEFDEFVVYVPVYVRIL